MDLFSLQRSLQLRRRLRCLYRSLLVHGCGPCRFRLDVCYDNHRRSTIHGSTVCRSRAGDGTTSIPCFWCPHSPNAFRSPSSGSRNTRSWSVSLPSSSSPGLLNLGLPPDVSNARTSSFGILYASTAGSAQLGWLLTSFCLARAAKRASRSYIRNQPRRKGERNRRL